MDKNVSTSLNSSPSPIRREIFKTRSRPHYRSVALSGLPCGERLALDGFESIPFLGESEGYFGPDLWRLTDCHTDHEAVVGLVTTLHLELGFGSHLSSDHLHLRIGLRRVEASCLEFTSWVRVGEKPARPLLAINSLPPPVITKLQIPHGLPPDLSGQYNTSSFPIGEGRKRYVIQGGRIGRFLKPLRTRTPRQTII